MKRIKLLTFVLAALVIGGTGCLKDKGFDNHEYGINDPDVAPAGIGFTVGIKPIYNTALTLSDESQLFEAEAVQISLLSGKPASADVHVKIQLDPTMVDAYNAANGTSIIHLDPALYNLASTDVVIPAGKLNGLIPFTIPSTMMLNPNEKYGLGLRIVSADAGYIIANNEKRSLLSIAIRNIYDGDYTSNGYVYHPAVPRPIIDRPKTLSTIDASTVECELGDLGGNGYIAHFNVDAANHVTITPAPGAGGAPYTQFDTDLPSTSPGYTPQWPHSSECNNTYDPATHTFKVRYGYVGGTGWRVTEELIVRD